VSDAPELPSEQSLGEWLRAEGPDADIALCTRVRFARNVQGYRFSTSMSADEATELNGFLTGQVQNLDIDEPLEILDVAAMEDLERSVLMERHVISRDLATADRSRSVAVNACQSISIMINEEDHLRMQAFRSGLQLADTYARAEQLDESLVAAVPLAFSEEFGFLTSCPTNTGTGLRVSVMLHLPGLAWADEMEKAIHTAQKIHLAVRGLYGEGSRALGDFYQVSNQVTLGRSEDRILGDVTSAVERLVSWERKVREALLQGESRPRTMDRVFRALGALQHAHILTSEECLNSLSAVRFGVQQGLIAQLSLRQLNQILLLTQPAHLQQLHGRRLDAPERDLLRAALVRRIVAGGT
jgi:protein arginine kinase